MAGVNQLSNLHGPSLTDWPNRSNINSEAVNPFCQIVFLIGHLRGEHASEGTSGFRQATSTNGMAPEKRGQKTARLATNLSTQVGSTKFQGKDIQWPLMTKGFGQPALAFQKQLRDPFHKPILLFVCCFWAQRHPGTLKTPLFSSRNTLPDHKAEIPSPKKLESLLFGRSSPPPRLFAVFCFLARLSQKGPLKSSALGDFVVRWLGGLVVFWFRGLVGGSHPFARVKSGIPGRSPENSHSLALSRPSQGSTAGCLRASTVRPGAGFFQTTHSKMLPSWRRVSEA